MKITGFKLAFRLRELQEFREMVASQFNDSLFQFADETATKPHPNELMSTFAECERKIAVLQVAQARYNLAVTVDVAGQPMTLHEAVKRVGGAGRVIKMWKTAARSEGTNPYQVRSLSRDKDDEHAHRLVPVQECMERSLTANRQANALRQAIQLGNAVELDLNDLTPDLFE